MSSLASVCTGAPRSFQSGKSSFRARGSNTLPGGDRGVRCGRRVASAAAKSADTGHPPARRHWGVPRRTARATGKQAAWCGRRRTGKDVGADLGPLVDDRDAEAGPALLLELLQPDCGGQARGPAPNDDHVEVHALTLGQPRVVVRGAHGPGLPGANPAQAAAPHAAAGECVHCSGRRARDHELCRRSRSGFPLIHPSGATVQELKPQAAATHSRHGHRACARGRSVPCHALCGGHARRIGCLVVLWVRDLDATLPPSARTARPRPLTAPFSRSQGRCCRFLLLWPRNPLRERGCSPQRG